MAVKNKDLRNPVQSQHGPFLFTLVCISNTYVYMNEPRVVVGPLLSLIFGISPNHYHGRSVARPSQNRLNGWRCAQDDGTEAAAGSALEYSKAGWVSDIGRTVRPWPEGAAPGPKSHVPNACSVQNGGVIRVATKLFSRRGDEDKRYVCWAIFSFSLHWALSMLLAAKERGPVAILLSRYTGPYLCR